MPCNCDHMKPYAFNPESYEDTGCLDHDEPRSRCLANSKRTDKKENTRAKRSRLRREKMQMREFFG